MSFGPALCQHPLYACVARGQSTSSRRYLCTIWSLLALLLALAGCSSTDPAATAPAAASEAKLVVFAASSLSDAFTALARDFQATHAGAEVVFNFAGTQELRTQLEHGAPADVFASADLKHMTALEQAKAVAEPRIFARNELVVVVANDSVTELKTLADLPKAQRVVLGLSDVPVGRYTLQMLDRAASTLGADFRARVEAHVVSREPNVRQVLAKVRLGEADAGVVYRSDAKAAAGAVQGVPIAADLNVIAEYPIAVTRGAAHPRLAERWLNHVLSAAGQRVLAEAGFLPPSVGVAAR